MIVSESLLVTILLWTILCSSFFTLLGMLTVFYWIKTPDAPADKSNVIARIRLWWFSLTRQGWVAKIYKAFRHDEMEIVEIIQSAGYCQWVQGQTTQESFMSECDRFHTFEDQGPVQNNMDFCCYCGKKVEEINNGDE